MILMRWHFSAVEATHVQSLVSALFVAVVGSGNSDIETVAQRLEESLRCEHWRREEVAKVRSETAPVLSPLHGPELRRS